MATIGTFARIDNGYAGTIRTLTTNAKVKIIPAEKTKDNAPDFRLYTGTVELGAAWKKTSNAGTGYLPIKLDDPTFPAAVYANLVAIDGEPETFASSGAGDLGEGCAASAARPIRCSGVHGTAGGRGCHGDHLDLVRT